MEITPLSGDLIITEGNPVGVMLVVTPLTKIRTVQERKGSSTTTLRGMSIRIVAFSCLIFFSLPLTGLSSNMSTISAQTPPASSLTSTTSSSADENPSTSQRQPQFKKSDLYGECSNPLDASQLDEKKVQEAIKKLTSRTAEQGEEQTSSHSQGKKKRAYNSMSTADVTPEEMEAYRRIKVQREDPMAKFLSNNSEELLEE